MRNNRITQQRTKKRNKTYFHFASLGETHEGRMLKLQNMEVARWFAIRHEGDTQEKRNCIKQSIARLKALRADFLSNVNLNCVH